MTIALAHVDLARAAGDTDDAHAAPDPVRRREFKYLLPALGDGRAALHVAGRVRALTRAYPPRRVTSLYFDSPTLTSYQESNAGVSERVKLRLRWYGELGPDTEFVLELKHRANHLGWKWQYPLGALPLAELSLGELARTFAHVVAPAERPLVSVRRVPVIVTSYWRHYFATADREIRVTVDTGLTVRDQRLRPRLNLAFDGARCDFAVVECKLDQARAPDAAFLLRRLAVRHTRFSKYCYGVERLVQRY